MLASLGVGDGCGAQQRLCARDRQLLTAHVTEPGNTQNFNRYAYVHNNPLTYIDPSGFWRVCYTISYMSSYGHTISNSTTSDPNHITVDGSRGHESKEEHCVDLPDLPSNFDLGMSGNDRGSGDGGSSSGRSGSTAGAKEAEKKTCADSAEDEPGPDGPRFPDYATYSMPLPYVPGLAATATLDRAGNVYVGPSWGVNLLTKSGKAAGVGWTGHTRTPSSEQLREWLSGWSLNAGFGLGFTWSSAFSEGNERPERGGLNLQVPGASIGWNIHVADIDVSTCY